MDPDTLYRWIRRNLAILAYCPTDEGIRDDAIEALRDLADWLENGGFPPQKEGDR